ncbi:hypothetical protein RHSIM_Rhsim01G0291100 [Rhododendron simsii]|uniref:Calcium-dependent phosphotriesterase superfamily protein n=1 Tax=Rhododendron simsii TaxID=118357 RepID=A0A834HF41_RHOSS|nr:hypothetical protein RHSIM_Rhsim01G0291100 [Rhododendron simsii]
MASFFCSAKFVLLLLVISAVPIAYLISLETAKPTSHVYHYHSTGWFREGAKWDDLNTRFLVSFMEGGVGQIRVPDDHSPGTVLEEVRVVTDVDLAGNASLGLVVDPPRNRLLVAIADVFGNRYGAVAAYDLTTWDRLFLTQLSGPGDGKTFADDVAVDAVGNSYITDAKGNKIWKVGVNGKFQSTITSPLFIPKEWYKNIVGLNGIVYHPNGYLVVIHTFSGNLYKVEIEKGDDVKLIEVEGGPLSFGDGLELLSPTRLVVAGNPSRLVESSNDWETAKVIGKSKGQSHRLVTAATVKNEKVYLNHILGLGYPRRKHVLMEAVFDS